MTPEQIRGIEARIAAAMGVVDDSYLQLECDIPRYLSDANASRELEKALEAEWDWIVGSGKTRPDEPSYGVALFRKGSMRGSFEPQPSHTAEDDDKLHAVAKAFCAVKGIAWPEEA